MRSVCVYCGSSSGASPMFAEHAASVGRYLAESGRSLIYGGGRVGLMGIVADAALSAGGHVVGIIPKALAEKEIAHAGLSVLHVVDSMHQRKSLMAELSDGFLALPGGLGTLEEFFEAWTWAQLGIHAKPCGLLNVDGFYDTLLQFLDQLVESRFVRAEHRAMLIHGADVSDVVQTMAASSMSNVPKWCDNSLPTASCGL